jgi:hypothetical protein
VWQRQPLYSDVFLHDTKNVLNITGVSKEVANVIHGKIYLNYALKC